MIRNRGNNPLPGSRIDSDLSRSKIKILWHQKGHWGSVGYYEVRFVRSGIFVSVCAAFSLVNQRERRAYIRDMVAARKVFPPMLRDTDEP